MNHPSAWGLWGHPRGAAARVPSVSTAGVEIQHVEWTEHTVCRTVRVLRVLQLVQMGSELSKRRVGRELDRAKGVGERELRLEAREVNEREDPDQQTASVSLLTMSKGVDGGEILQIMRTRDVHGRYDVPVQRRVDALPGGKGFSGPVGFYLQAGGDASKLPPL